MGLRYSKTVKEVDKNGKIKRIINHSTNLGSHYLVRTDHEAKK